MQNPFSVIFLRKAFYGFLDVVPQVEFSIYQVRVEMIFLLL